MLPTSGRLPTPVIARTPEDAMIARLAFGESPATHAPHPTWQSLQQDIKNCRPEGTFGVYLTGGEITLSFRTKDREVRTRAINEVLCTISRRIGPIELVRQLAEDTPTKNQIKG